MFFAHHRKILSLPYRLISFHEISLSIKVTFLQNIFFCQLCSGLVWIAQHTQFTWLNTIRFSSFTLVNTTSSLEMLSTLEHLTANFSSSKMQCCPMHILVACKLQKHLAIRRLPYQNLTFAVPICVMDSCVFINTTSWKWWHSLAGNQSSLIKNIADDIFAIKCTVIYFGESRSVLRSCRYLFLSIDPQESAEVAS